MIASPTQHAAPTLGFSFSAKYNDLSASWVFVYEESNLLKYCYLYSVTLKHNPVKRSFFVKTVTSC